MGEDASSLVMGSIVEKNLNIKHTSTPSPTVISFPVARHRSSGPHWKPVPARSENENVAHEAESGDIVNFNSVASFAKPVLRDQKKALNLKSLKGHLLDSHYLDSENMDEDDCLKESKFQLETLKGIDESSGGNEAEAILSASPLFKSRQTDIDNENQLRLQEMSAEEIAEAQAELNEKMTPSLIDFLRKRGLSKKRNLSAVDPSARHLETESNKLRNKSSPKEISLRSSSSSSTNYIPDRKQSTSSTNIAQNSIKECKNNQWENLCYSNSSSWNSWSQRVEAVREYRFSLEGEVISEHLDDDSLSVKFKLGANNVGERDILRSEGDPAAAGYTILEAAQLSRSLIPGQRSIALHLLASLLNSAINGLQNRVSLDRSSDLKCIDWEAIWGYALGPEPELALVLRLSLDDNHNLVVFTCAKAIHNALTCHLNEKFFNISEKVGSYGDLFTAPIFRSKPEVETGFVRGGFWKLSAKSSTILNASDYIDEDEAEERHTIRDDVVIAEQDFTAGLVKMGIIQKLQHLLENDPSASMEIYVVSSIVAIARHSPTCANAILKCPGLIKTIVQRFQIGVCEYTNYAKISSVVLLKVLSKTDKKNCLEFMRNGYFQIMASNLFHSFSSLNDWVKLGKERAKFFSKLIVEQLRYWKVCINNGFGLSYFQSIFSTLCVWLACPSPSNLLNNDLFGEFASVSAEAFLVLRSLSRRLPNLYCQGQINGDDVEETVNWEWRFVGPLVDSAISWLTFKNGPYLCSLLAAKNDDKSLQCSFLWVLSSVFHFFSSFLERIIPSKETRNDVPWLPEFVPLIGLEILKQRFLWCPDETENSFIEVLCSLREQDDDEVSLASTSCLSSLLLTVTYVDNLIKLSRSQIHNISSTDSSLEAKLLEEGIQQRCSLELKRIFESLSSKISSQWTTVQSIEAFGRGGPAPGVGIGWGLPRGGFWSAEYMLLGLESDILCHILTRAQDFNCVASDFCRLNLMLKICLTFGTSNRENCAKIFDCLFGVPVLKQLGNCVQEYFRFSDSKADLEYTEDDYSMFSARLSFHYSSFWLSTKQKAVKHSSTLTTIHENTEHGGCTVEMTEWANQRLPLPLHWLCSSIAISSNYKYSSHDVLEESYDGKEIAKSGLFFLLGMEIMSSSMGVANPSPIFSIPLIWKLHSLSALLLSDMSVLEDDKSRAVYEALQDIYSRYLDRNLEIRRFQTEIHHDYCTFVEILVEQFSAESYGDVVFGRQIALYLQSRVESPVKLAVWNALSSGHSLDILPCLERCIGNPDAYLSPMKESDSVLEAYVKSWTSGALDRAVTRKSMAFVLAAHHISSFVFGESNENLSLKNKLVKFLVRDYAASPKRQEMMMYLMRYNGYPTSKDKDDIDNKFRVLVESCDNDSSLLLLVENLRSNFA